MAWSQQKNPGTGNPELVFSGLEQGIGTSPQTGIEILAGINIKNYPSVGYSNIARANSTQPGGGVAYQVNYIVQDPQNINNLYAQGFDGVIYQSLNAGLTWTTVTAIGTSNNNGNGLVILLSNTSGGIYNATYLLACSDSDINAIQINASGTTGSWVTMQSNSSGVMFATAAPSGYRGYNHSGIASINVNQVTGTLSNGQPVIFFCNNSYISSLQGVTGQTFDPSNNGTYLWTEKNLLLPIVAGGVSTSLVELKGSLYVTVGNLIVPWDYQSVNYGVPFAYTEFIHKATVIDNIIYAFGGAPVYQSHSGTVLTTTIAGRGYIYYYDGWSGGVLKKVPDHLTGTFDPTIYIGGTMRHLDKLWFSCTPTLSGVLSGLGVMSIDINNQSYGAENAPAGALSIENSDGLFYNCLFSLNNTLVNSTTLSYAGAYTQIVAGPSTNYIFDYTDQSGNREQGLIKTDIIKVGTNQDPKTFNQVEVRFMKPLIHNETVFVAIYNYFNHQVTGSYTYTAPSGSTDLSFVFPVFSQSAEYIQVYVLTTPLQNGSGVPIQEIILR